MPLIVTSNDITRMEHLIPRKVIMFKMSVRKSREHPGSLHRCVNVADIRRQLIIYISLSLLKDCYKNFTMSYLSCNRCHLYLDP